MLFTKKKRLNCCSKQSREIIVLQPARKLIKVIDLVFVVNKN